MLESAHQTDAAAEGGYPSAKSTLNGRVILQCTMCVYTEHCREWMLEAIRADHMYVHVESRNLVWPSEVSEPRMTIPHEIQG